MNTLFKSARHAVLAAAVASISLVSGSLLACAGDSWTFPVLVMDPPRKTADIPFEGKETSYTSLDSSEVTKKWNLCFLAPHTTNDILRAYLYGTVEEAKRLSAKLTIFDAGGYGNLDKQLAQFDDCVTLGADAIMLMAVSATAFNQKIAEARAKGIKVIDVNVGVNTEVDGRIVPKYEEAGVIIGRALAKAHPSGSGKASTVVMPGPAGVVWSEAVVKGLNSTVGGTDVAVEKVVYGAPGRLDQQPLVEDVLTTYPSLNTIVGMGTTLEAALNSLREQGRLGSITLYGTFFTPDLMKAVKEGQVAGVVTENAIYINKLTVDMTVRILEGKAKVIDANPAVTLADKSTVDDVPKNNFAPADWKIQMTVE